MTKSSRQRFAMCINNDGNPASFEIRKVYRVLPDSEARKLKLVRVIDESGSDYLYPADQFVAVHLSEPARKAVLLDR